ncbi:uncharacterized protein YcfL [Peribacillus deserti]|uniref:Uncharacterized protein YcfL n=1 Tax=Peribacillus deserti TaxID=673318 RepID=A0ABS2QKS9_9BACI|nr:hypothetical protein [Peribacillus deserti]MBM7693717.1 uncharacterized protein YcfL [Peribacillus deserti]
MNKLYLLVITSVLLVSCSSGKESRINEKTDGVKEITIKIHDYNKNEQHYLLNIMTNGKQQKDVAQFPENRLIITNERKEAKVKFHLNTNYTINVSKTNAKTIKEFYSNKKSEQALEIVSKKIDFKPDLQDKELSININ